MLAGLEHAHGELGMRRDGRRQDHRVDVRIGQHLGEIVCEAGARVLACEPRAGLLRRVAAPRKLAVLDRREIAGEVRAPVAEAHQCD